MAPEVTAVAAGAAGLMAGAAFGIFYGKRIGELAGFEAAKWAYSFRVISNAPFNEPGQQAGQTNQPNLSPGLTPAQIKQQLALAVNAKAFQNALSSPGPYIGGPGGGGGGVASLGGGGGGGSFTGALPPNEPTAIQERAQLFVMKDELKAGMNELLRAKDGLIGQVAEIRKQQIMPRPKNSTGP